MQNNVEKGSYSYISKAMITGGRFVYPPSTSKSRSMPCAVAIFEGIVILGVAVKTRETASSAPTLP